MTNSSVYHPREMPYIALHHIPRASCLDFRHVMSLYSDVSSLAVLAARLRSNYCQPSSRGMKSGTRWSDARHALRLKSQSRAPRAWRFVVARHSRRQSRPDAAQGDDELATDGSWVPTKACRRRRPAGQGVRRRRSHPPVKQPPLLPSEGKKGGGGRWVGRRG